MISLDARTVPVDPRSTQRLAESGLVYRVVDVRAPQEGAAFARADSRGFLDAEPTDALVDRLRDAWSTRRNVGVFERDASADALPVGTVNSWVTPLTVPGGEIPMWAISTVTVAATHRRRGIARNLLEGELRAAAGAGVPIAGLTVTEATIYARYGFAPAVPVADVEVDTTRAGWAGDPVAGRLEYLERPGLQAALDEVHERSRTHRSGQIAGWPARWARAAGMSDPEKGRDVRGVRFVDAEGVTRGALAYTLHEQPGAFRFHLSISHLAAETAEALRALWGFAVTHDLVTRVAADLRPVDDPILQLVADQRAVTFRVHDHGWLRVLDVAKALSSRTYSAEADAVIRVDDPLGIASGTWRVRTAEGAAATVEPTDAEADVRLGVGELSAVYAGGVPLSQLAAAGRVLGDAEPVAALSRAFRTDPAPLLGIWY